MISFVRVDDRIIHGQIVTRWSKEFPCDGIIAVNDKAATTPVLKQSLKHLLIKKYWCGRWNTSWKKHRPCLTVKNAIS